MIILQKILAFIVALGVLIVIHELGHYFIARLCNVKVLRFSVGFGKPLFSRRFGKDQTEWAVAAIPLGGYVKMVDEREGEVAPEDLPRAFNRQSVAKRFAIVAAGPIANFLLAIIFYWGLFAYGVPDLKPVLGTPQPDSIAAQAGQRAGDSVVAVNGKAVSTWQDVRWQVLQRALDHEEIQLEVLDANNERKWRNLAALKGVGDEPEGDVIGRLGLHSFDIPPILGDIKPGSPAEQAGLRSGDHIRAVAGEPIASYREFVQRVSASLGKPLALSVRRDGSLREVIVTPQDAGADRPGTGRIGAAADFSVFEQHKITVQYGIGGALSQALVQTWEMSVFSLDCMWKMVTLQLSLRNLSGPITIADYAGQSAQMGLAPFITFLALISISLGILNLLPIPLLDGGHLMYYTIEFFKGSPVSERLMDFGQRAGLAMLLALMVFAFYNDINRLLG